MAEDVLHHDERRRLEALALAARVHSTAGHISPGNVIETAAKFDEFLRGDRAQGRKDPIVAQPGDTAE